MSQENTQETIQQTSLNEKPKDIQSIAADVDFKPYLEAVKNSSQRTRSIIYVLIAALLLIISAIRNTTYPDWTNSRLSQLQLAYACLEENNLSSDCHKSVAYARQFVFQGTYIKGANGSDELPSGAPLKTELREQINAFIRQRTDGMTLRLPFFGIAIDMNDLGILGGLLLAALLYVLYASLSREADNIERARKKAERNKDPQQRDDNLELLVMAQVLVSPSTAKLRIGHGVYVLLTSVVLIHLIVVITDTMSFNIAETLQGRTWAVVETVLDWVVFILVVVCCALCIWQQKKLNKNLREIPVS